MKKLLLAGLPGFVLLLALLPSIAFPDPTLSVTLLNPNIQVFRIADFDFTNAMNNPLIFRVTISNDQTRSLKLSLTVLSDVHGTLGTGTSTAYNMPGPSELVFTNRNIGDSTFPFKISNFDVANTGDELKNVVMNTGTLPADTYTFKIQLLDGNTDAMLAQGDISITVDNPNTLELLGPGTRFGGELLSINWPPPPFQWTSRAKKFNFTLVELRPDQMSGDEAMDNQPQYQLKRYESPFTGSHMLTYPSSAEALLEGHTYCWKVEAIVTTSGGENVVQSEIYWFKIGRREMAPVSDASSQVSKVLALLPPDVLGDALSQLEGYAATGNIFLDNKKITLEELRAMIDEIKRDTSGLREVFVR